METARTVKRQVLEMEQMGRAMMPVDSLYLHGERWAEVGVNNGRGLGA